MLLNGRFQVSQKHSNEEMYTPVAIIPLNGDQTVFKGGDQGFTAFISVHSGLLNNCNGG